ncbi:ribonuclease E/G, partial [bacterium]|nr:ribonuclease E/G [bacterium]
ETQDAPSLLYRDQDLLYRVIREACTEDVVEIVVDTPFALQRTQQILQNWNMLKNVKLTVYKGTEPLLQASGIIKEIKEALQVKVMLPSGGYLFIQTTEAISVVDVNSGKFVSSATQDETILKTNIEAAHEIARQLRLRNIGGMIIIDFIDMTSRNDKLAVMEEFELALENDKAKPQIGQLSDLGLVELTRHRQGQSLSEVFTKKCPHCQGTGLIFEDIQFASAPGEGELKSKAAKLKLPVQQLKNKNTNNNNVVFSTRTGEDIENIPESQVLDSEQQSIEENDYSQENQNNYSYNNKFGKNNRFNKNKNRFNNKYNKNNYHQQNSNEYKKQEPNNDNFIKDEKDTILPESLNKNIPNTVTLEENHLIKEDDNVNNIIEKQDVIEKEITSTNVLTEEINDNKNDIVVENVKEEPKKRVRKTKTSKKEESKVTIDENKEIENDKTDEKPKKRGRKPKAKTE